MPTAPTSPTAPTATTRYLCQRCGNCCRWPGDVQLDQTDIHALARFLRRTEAQFIEEHTKLNRTRTGLSLKENPDGSCIFLDGHNACSVQEAKPAQCRAFPNAWRFPGWRALCDAIPVRAESTIDS